MKAYFSSFLNKHNGAYVGIMQGNAFKETITYKTKMWKHAHKTKHDKEP